MTPGVARKRHGANFPQKHPLHKKRREKRWRGSGGEMTIKKLFFP
jgi:hypothetical protein